MIFILLFSLYILHVSYDTHQSKQNALNHISQSGPKKVQINSHKPKRNATDQPIVRYSNHHRHNRTDHPSLSRSLSLSPLLLPQSLCSMSFLRSHLDTHATNNHHNRHEIVIDSAAHSSSASLSRASSSQGTKSGSTSLSATRIV